jgi:hypothetical protein
MEPAVHFGPKEAPQVSYVPTVPTEAPPALGGELVEGDPLPGPEVDDPSDQAGGSTAVEPDDESDKTVEATSTVAKWVPAIAAGIALFGIVIMLSPKKKK